MPEVGSGPATPEKEAATRTGKAGSPQGTQYEQPDADWRFSFMGEERSSVPTRAEKCDVPPQAAPERPAPVMASGHMASGPIRERAPMRMEDKIYRRIQAYTDLMVDGFIDTAVRIARMRILKA